MTAGRAADEIRSAAMAMIGADDVEAAAWEFVEACKRSVPEHLWGAFLVDLNPRLDALLQARPGSDLGSDKG